MFKNVAGTFLVFCFDVTTGLPKTGDAVNLTAYVKIDAGAVTVLADTSATEEDATNAKGYYRFDAAQAETNGDRLMVSAKSATANISVIGAPAVIYTRPTTASAVQAMWDALTTALTTPGSIGKHLTDAIDTPITSRMASYTQPAGFLATTFPAGTVASSAEATAIQNNTRVVRVVPTVIERPDSGTVTYRIELLLYDAVGNMEAPDSAPTIALVNQAGTDLIARLDFAGTMQLVSTGRYRSIYTADAADTLEQLVWAFSVVEGGATRIYGNTTLIVDTTAVDFTAADRTKLDTLHDTRIPGVIQPQTGDSFARLGAPAGVSVSADMAAVKADSVAILVDTGTTLDGRIPAALTGDGNMKSDILRINGNAAAAAVLAILNGATVVYQGTVTGAATTTTLIDSGLTQADPDWWKGRIIIFTSVIAMQATDITAFDPALDKLTFTACTQAPTGATYVII